MDRDRLVETAQAMVARGKGILAADESSGTIAKRFSSLGVKSTQDTRRDYRELLFRARDALKQDISAVILFDETIRQTAKDGSPLVKLIEAAGAIPGIKVDAGVKPLPNYPGETITEGTRRPRRPFQGLFGAGRSFREMAGGHRHRREYPHPLRS